MSAGSCIVAECLVMRREGGVGDGEENARARKGGMENGGLDEGRMEGEFGQRRLPNHIPGWVCYYFLTGTRKREERAFILLSLQLCPYLPLDLISVCLLTTLLPLVLSPLSLRFSGTVLRAGMTLTDRTQRPGLCMGIEAHCICQSNRRRTHLAMPLHDRVYATSLISPCLLVCCGCGCGCCCLLLQLSLLLAGRLGLEDFPQLGTPANSITFKGNKGKGHVRHAQHRPTAHFKHFGSTVVLEA